MKTRPGTLYNSFWCRETIAFVVKSLRFTVYSILEKVTYIKDLKITVFIYDFLYEGGFYQILHLRGVNPYIPIYRIYRCINLSSRLLMLQDAFASCLGHTITLRVPQKLTELSIVVRDADTQCHAEVHDIVPQ